MSADKRASADPFERFIEYCLLDAVAKGITCFEPLILALPSVYPSFVLRALSRLALAQKLPSCIAEHAQASARQGAVYETGQPSYEGLPVPHPLDYEWRFTAAATKRLLEGAHAFSVPGDTVALLGVPSVFYTALTRQESGIRRNFALVDANRCLLENIKHLSERGSVIECDILHGQLPGLTAQVVVVDAPWYPPYLRAFLRAASQICVEGGHMLVSMPPIGTRPGIEEEWQDLLQQAERMNLHLEERHPLSLPYASPFFERNALRAEGITCYPSDWRRSDLVIFRQTEKTDLPPLPETPSVVEWQEERVHGVRIRVRAGGNEGFYDPTLISVIPGDVLPSVSRRDKRRKLADVWTSGNRIFRCEGRRVLQEILRAAASGEDAQVQVSCALRRTLTRNEAQLVAHASAQVSELVRIERSEMGFNGT